MHPTVFDLEVWAEHQRSDVRRALQQASLTLPTSPSRIRTAVARTLIASRVALLPGSPPRRHDREVEDLLHEAEFGTHATFETESPPPRGLRRLTFRLRALVSQTA